MSPLKPHQRVVAERRKFRRARREGIDEGPVVLVEPDFLKAQASHKKGSGPGRE